MTQPSANGFDLGGRVALVTGAASGIGAGIARVLANLGATVVIADRDADGAAREVARWQASRPAGGVAGAVAGSVAGSVTVDLADEASIVHACQQVVDRYGAPFALVNNAGIQDRELLLEGTAMHWDRMNAINGRAPFLMTREIGRAMIAAGRGGRIINIASVSLLGQLIKGLAAYAASKGALLALSRVSAFELIEHGITVNTVLPGGVATPGAIGATGPAPEGPARRKPPLGLCEPEDIGAAVAFFASPAARAVTNQVLAVDGGWSVT